MVGASGHILRMDSVDYQKKVEETVRTVVDDIVDDDASKYMISGDRVELAEEIAVVQHVKHKLEAFVDAAEKERR